VGVDSFLAEEALERIVGEVLGGELGGAVQVWRGEEASWSRVVDNVSMRSLFADRRALVVRGAEGLKGEGEEVTAYLKDPTPGVFLVLLARKADRRRAVWKAVLDGAEVIAAEPLRGRALRSFVAERLRQRGLRLAEDALQELLERVGQDLRRLMGEVDKLEAFRGGEKTLSAEDVAKVLGRGMARPLYRLSDATSERDASLVLELVGELLDEGEQAPLIVGTMHRALRQVRAALAMTEARVPREAIASKLLPPNMSFKLPALLEAARRWSEPELRKAVAALGAADLAVKTSVDPRVALAGAVASTVRPSRRPAR
jgi:DNA polymerase-3 subunit delta